MSAALLVLSACALVTADRYADYPAVSMPQYSMEESNRLAPSQDDYPERSATADVPPPFDYKYEEELRDKVNKMPMKYEEENWHKPSETLKDPPNSPDDDELQKNEDESVPNPEDSRKIRRHRTRSKNTEIDRQEKHYRQKASKVRSRRIGEDDVDNKNEYYANKGRTREDSSIESDDVNFRKTTEKVIRRKPRDRRINLRRLDVDDDDDDEDSKPLEGNDRIPLRRHDIKGFGRTDDAEYVPNRKTNSWQYKAERPSFVSGKRMRNKNYPEYDDDYYDMKRVNDMKNKLPDLLRSTQASTSETPNTRPVQDFPYRRANLSKKTTTTPKPTSKRTTRPINVTVYASKSATNSTELSLAEKSRLSILKKALRKDDVKNAALTSKPPVLLEVTRRVHTLVMVEPPQPDERQGAREVVDDSPGRIAKAKRLMRQKLVAGARSIHDLTDNWDEMVCDYIDEALLDGAPLARPTWTLPLLSLITLY